MSMISELVEKLRGKSYCVMFPPEFRRLLAQAADTIEELSAKLSAAQMERSSQYYHGGWVPCEERMPEEDGFYLVTIKDKDIFSDKKIRKVRVNCFNEKSGAFELGSKVVAWSPLPEPYMEVRDEKTTK